MWILVIFIGGILLVGLIQEVTACEMPTKNIVKRTTLFGNVYSKTYIPFGKVYVQTSNRIFINGYRLIQNKDYEIVAIVGKNMTCIKKLTSYPSLMAYCDNSFCGYFEYCGTINKNLKNATYSIYNAEDVNCSKKNVAQIIKNKKPILK